MGPDSADLMVKYLLCKELPPLLTSLLLISQGSTLMAQDARVESDYFALKDIAKDVFGKILTLVTKIEDAPQHYLLIKVTILERITELYEVYFTEVVNTGTLNRESSSITTPKQHLAEIMGSISKHPVVGFEAVLASIEQDLPYTCSMLMLPIYVLQYTEEKRGPNKAMRILDPNATTNFRKEILATMQLYIESGLQSWVTG